MICCENCFKDSELVNIIRGLKVKGDCDVCNSKDVFIYDSIRYDDLKNVIYNLIDIYSPADDSSKSLLINELYDRWELFNVEIELANKIINDLFVDTIRNNPQLFNTSVKIPEESDPSYLEKNSLFKQHSRDDFSEEIISYTRFHTEIINKKVFDEFCNYSRITIKKGTKFYRARLSNKDGYPPSEMGPPPRDKATSGRVNPLGIPYFYLSDSEVTTIYETRAKQHDYISIAEFELVEDIEVIDFTILDKTSPFSVEDITSYALNKIHLNRVSSEIAKPLRRTDSQLQYLPTQYLVDFIKWKGNSGIKFKSSLYPAGTNYTVFNAELFKCNSVKVYDVAKVDYYFELVT